MNNLSLLIKPASSLCNMRCKYCFYHDVAEHRDTKSHGIMDNNTTEMLIEQAFEYINHKGVINFAFQGGEPTLAGVEYFKYFTNTVDEYNKNNLQVNYSIQTNGQVIDEEFCKLFKKYNFLVGLSQDGPREFHDVNRVDTNLKGTFDKTNDAIKLMNKYDIEYNILSVITRQMARKPKTLFNYYKKQNFKYIQLIPCLNPLEENSDNEQHELSKEIKKYALTPHDYGNFLIDFFNLWYDEFMKGNYISVRLFDNIVHMLKGRGPEQCGVLGKCNIQCVVESDGSIYPCDFYVLDRFKLGNIHEDKLINIYTPANGTTFLEFEEAKHPLCNSCKVYSICMGGCKRYRSFYRQESDYCPYQDFLYTSFDKLQRVASVVG